MDTSLTVTTTRTPVVLTKLSNKRKTWHLSSPILSQIFHSPVTASIFSEDKFIKKHLNQTTLLLTWAKFSFQSSHVRLSSLQPMEILINSFQFIIQGGRSCTGARVAPAEKFELGRKFLARTYAILSQIKICRNLRIFFWRSLGKKVPFWVKTVLLGQEVHY